VIETLAGDEDGALASFYDKLETDAERQLLRAAERFQHAAIDPWRVIRFGRRGPEIVRYAAEHGVDLIVLSSHKIAAGGDAQQWSTLSYQVSIACQCSVLLVK
jgi:nucleotide-binding universal stress UspA family protein